MSHNKRLDWNEYFMSIAKLTSVRSSCKRLQVGCVIVKDKHIVSTGYNGFLPSFPHESIVVNNHEQATVHAEQNAIADAACRGTSVNNGIAYITHYPCINCFKILVASGIKTIYYLNDYNNDPTINILLQKNSSITILKIDI
jgi:dCMP deaminase